MNMNAKYFWNRVNDQIKAHKLSQTQFASFTGIPEGTFQEWADNKRIPDLHTTFLIAATLGISLNYLIHGTQEARDKR